ncbi:ribonuclease E inhibitor RraB [Lysobacter terrae]
MHDLIDNLSAMGDHETLSLLRRSGSHMNQAHPTEFYLYFPELSPAEKASARVVANGYRVSVETCTLSGRWLVLAGKSILLTAENLAFARSELSAIAESEGGVYDGWASRLMPSLAANAFAESTGESH